MQSLPADVLQEVFAYIPPLQLLRLRPVCRVWAEEISSLSLPAPVLISDHTNCGHLFRCFPHIQYLRGRFLGTQEQFDAQMALLPDLVSVRVATRSIRSRGFQDDIMKRLSTFSVVRHAPGLQHLDLCLSRDELAVFSDAPFPGERALRALP